MLKVLIDLRKLDDSSNDLGSRHLFLEYDSLDKSYNESSSGFHYIYEIGLFRMSTSSFQVDENGAKGKDVSSIIKTIHLKRQELESEFTSSGQLVSEGLIPEQRFVKSLDPQVIELYRGVAKVLAKYKSGVLPKAFKIIPTLSNWEQILEFTDPNSWTAASMCQATKLFSSNLKDDMAQRFYNIILLPRLRDDIAEFKKLNFHLYSALKRSLYKPGAFYKGIVLPLCEDSAETTIREAVIISSIIKKVHVPLMHSAATILKISEMTFKPTRCVFLHDLICKNYALPYRVLDGIVEHFTRYTYDEAIELPVLWHQTLNKFCELYAKDISPEQREAIMDLIRHHSHHDISPSIRKLLLDPKLPQPEMQGEPDQKS